jgi:hypothetical protein
MTIPLVITALSMRNLAWALRTGQAAPARAAEILISLAAQIELCEQSGGCYASHDIGVVGNQRSPNTPLGEENSVKEIRRWQS